MPIRTNRIRKLRKSVQLSQGELAFLLGLQSQATLSEHEASYKAPRAETVLACAVIFDVSVHHLFCGIDVSVRSQLLRRARKLLGRLPQDGSRETTREFLTDLARRLRSARAGP
jgi:transcriptional regulator with XRE-family HTH domain